MPGGRAAAPSAPSHGPAPLLECVGRPGLVLQGQTQTLGCFQASHQLSLSRKPSTTTAHYKIQQRGKYLAFPRAFSPEVKLLCICNATLEGWAVRACCWLQVAAGTRSVSLGCPQGPGREPRAQHRAWNPTGSHAQPSSDCPGAQHALRSNDRPPLHSSQCRILAAYLATLK